MHIELFTTTQAKLVNVNARSEKHGPDELVPAIDLRLQVDVANGVLSQLDPALREWLFEQGDQPSLPEVDGAAGDRTKLRFPQIDWPLRWNDEAEDYCLTLTTGPGGEDIQLQGCKLHRLAITAKEGGTCTLVFRLAITAKEGGTCTLVFTVSCAQELTESIVGRLATHVQHDVHVKLYGGEPSGVAL
jgi:hypothetical protein